MRVWAGPVILSGQSPICEFGRGPLYLVGGAHYASVGGARYTHWARPVICLFIYVWYVGELNKLCAYGFQFMF